MKIRRLRKSVDPVAKLARNIGVPEEQLLNGSFEIKDVANRTEADQRASVRSGETRTLKRVCSVDVMLRRGELSKEEAAACSWYADTHTRGYSTVSVTARYGDTGTGGSRSYSHFAVDLEQEENRQNYKYATGCISPFLLPIFEAVIIHGRVPTKHEMKSVKLAAIQLFGGICHMIPLR